METSERAVLEGCEPEKALRDALISKGKAVINAVTFFSNFGAPLNLSGKPVVSFKPKLKELVIPIDHYESPVLGMKYCEVGLRYADIDRVEVVKKEGIINVKFKNGGRLVTSVSFPLDSIEEASTAVMNLELLSEVADRYPELKPYLLILERIWGRDEALLAEVGKKYIMSCEANLDYYVRSNQALVRIPVDGKVLKDVWLYREVMGENLLGELVLEQGFRAMFTLKLRRNTLHVPVPNDAFGNATVSSLATLLENEGAVDDVEKLCKAMSDTSKILSVFAGVLALTEKTS